MVAPGGYIHMPLSRYKIVVPDEKKGQCQGIPRPAPGQKRAALYVYSIVVYGADFSFIPAGVCRNKESVRLGCAIRLQKNWNHS